MSTQPSLPVTTGPPAEDAGSPPSESDGASGNSRRRRWSVAIIILLTGAMAAPFAIRSLKAHQFNAACEAARSAEDWYSLRDSARRWVEWEPTASRGWWLAAEAAQQLQDHADLAHCLGKIPPSDPNALLAYSEKANLEWTVLNRPLDALQTSRRVLQMDERVLEVHSRVISFYAMTLQRSKMLQAIRRAIRARAEPRECYSYLMVADLMSFTNGADLNSRWLAAEPDEVRFKIGLAVHTSMSIEQALGTSTGGRQELKQQADQQLAWFLEKAPSDPVLLTHLMHTAYKASDLNRVAELLQQVSEEAAGDHMVWVFRAWYHSQMDEHERALEAIQEALKLHPISPLARHEYASILRRSQQSGVARQQQLAAVGRELRTRVLQLTTAADIDAALLREIQQFAADCGDDLVAAALQYRLASPAGQPSLFSDSPTP